jgi:hypothetical protein
MKDMADGLSRSEVVDRVIEVAEVLVREAAAFGSGKGDGGHDIWATLDEVE